MKDWEVMATVSLWGSLKDQVRCQVVVELLNSLTNEITEARYWSKF